MAIQFFDGFDQYASAANLALSYPSMTQTNWTVPNTGQPFGRGRIAVHASGVASSGLPKDLPTAVPTGTAFGFSCHLMVNSYPAAFDRAGIIQFMEGGTNHMDVRVGSDGSLYPTRNGSYITTATNRQLQLGQWYHFECKMVVHDTLGEVEIRIDGETWYIMNSSIMGTNVDTRNAATGTINAIRMLPKFSGSTPGSFSIDNAVFWDATGAVNNNWLGSAEVLTIQPDADDSVTGWAANTGAAYAAIDDGAAGSDGDTTYIASANNGDIASFTLADLPITPDTVLAVESFIVARKTDSATRNLRHGIVSGSDMAESADTPMGAAYAGFFSVFETDPQGGGAWTAARVNALKSRVKVQS